MMIHLGLVINQFIIIKCFKLSYNKLNGIIWWIIFSLKLFPDDISDEYS